MFVVFGVVGCGIFQIFFSSRCDIESRAGALVT